MDVVVSNNALFVQKSDPQDLINFVNLEPSFISFARNSPIAIFAALFQPLAWDVSGFPKILSGIENVFILVFTIIFTQNLEDLRSSPIVVKDPIHYTTHPPE